MIQDSQHKLLDILHAFGPNRTALPINEAILEPSRTVWHTPVSTRKMPEKHYYVPAKDVEFLFSYPNPNSPVVHAASERAREQHLWSTPAGKEDIHLDMLGRKVLSSLQLRIGNYQALLAK